MKLRMKIAVLVGALAAFAVAPAALAAQPGTHSNKGHHYGQENGHPQGHENEPGPKASLPEKAKAYGVHCRGASKEHVKGEKGTEFSRCVTAMAKSATHEKMNAKRACRGLSKKHEKGQKGTEFSRCVVAAAQLKKEERQQQREERREDREGSDGEAASS